MPNKYSHGLVLSQQQWGIIDTHPSSSLDLPSPYNSRSYARPATSSKSSHSDYSTPSSMKVNHVHLESNSGSAPSYSRRTSTHTDHLSFDFTISDTPTFESTSSQRSRPPSDRLRLESPFGFRIENPPSPPPRSEPALSEHPYYDYSSSSRPSFESSPQERLRLEEPSPLRPRSRRPSLHHKTSSVETQIYAPEPTTSSPPTREGRNSFSQEAYEPSATSALTHERQYRSPVSPQYERQTYTSPQHTPASRRRTSPTFTLEHEHEFSMESPENYPPSISAGNRQERFSSESQRAHLHSPTRDRRQLLIQKTHAPAVPSPVPAYSGQSPSRSRKSPLSPSIRGLQDYFSIETQGPQSTTAASGDRQDVSSVKARSALSSPSKNDRVRPSMDMQRFPSPPQTREHQRHPSLGMQHFSSERRPLTSQGSVHGRRQSNDSQTPGDRQNPRSLGPRCLYSDQSNKDTQRSRKQSIDSKTAQDRLLSSSPSSQQLSLEQFIMESEYIQDPLIDSRTYPHQRPPSSMGKSNPRQTALTDAQRYAPRNSSLQHSPQSRRNRSSNSLDTFASQHRIIRPNSQGAYDNVLIETHGFPPERPPSPPATPDSSKSFSLTPQVEESPKTRPPPIPQRSAKRSPSRQPSLLRSTNPSNADLPLEPPRPKTSSAVDGPTNWKKGTALHSPTFSISTRRSSINATMSPSSAPFSNFSETITSPGRTSFAQPRDRESFEDVDLEPLPSEVDFNVLPYENPNVSPAIFRPSQLGLKNPVSPRYEAPNAGPSYIRATQLRRSVSHDRSVSSRASSFDSAAPPPIGLNRRITHVIAGPDQSKMPKKESKMSLLSFLRSTPAPKAVLYSEARQGKQPVSKTAVSSIPSHQTQEKGPRSGPEPRLRPSLDVRSPAHMDAAEKRKSWLKGDAVDDSRLEKKREFERILNRI